MQDYATKKGALAVLTKPWKGLLLSDQPKIHL